MRRREVRRKTERLKFFMIDLYAHVGVLNMRVIFVIRMMKISHRPRSAVQDLIRPSSILVTELCEKVQASDHASQIDFLFDATP